MSHHIRWMIRRDMPSVLTIEEANFEFPWNEDDFVGCLRQRNCIGMVCENEEEDRVVGFMLYELHKEMLNLLNFAVAPLDQRSGVGTNMIYKLKDKLSVDRRSKILLVVRETNLNAQFFFREMGFRAKTILRNHFEYTGEDSYLMDYSCENLTRTYAETIDEGSHAEKTISKPVGVFNSITKFLNF